MNDPVESYKAEKRRLAAEYARMKRRSPRWALGEILKLTDVEAIHALARSVILK